MGFSTNFVRWLLLILFLQGACLLSNAAITRFDLVRTSPAVPLTNPNERLGSSIELVLELEADRGQYTINVYRNSNLDDVLATDRDFRHVGGLITRKVKAPLLESSNEFFIKVLETSTAGGEASTSSQGITIERDLEFDLASLRLNHVEGSNSSVPLFTNEDQLTVFYSLGRNARLAQVDVLVNNAVVASQTDDLETNPTFHRSISGITLQSNTLNLIQLKAKSMDPGGQGFATELQSNILRIFHDDTAPTIQSITPTFPGAAPPAGTPWGPTDLASIGLLIQADTPFARIQVLNTRTGDEVERFASNSGILLIAGIELTRDPSLGAVGITTTSYSINVFDETGNLGVGTIDVERLALEPCFNLLKMTPFDGGFLPRNRAIQISGAVCDELKPHRVRFSISSLFSANSFFIEEQLRNLDSGASFLKDIAIPVDNNAPNDNVSLSVQAEVFTTDPFDPKKEEVSKAHDLGTIILDRKAPPPPTILTERVLFSTHAPSFTVDGQVERESMVDINSDQSFLIRPSAKLSAIGDEFRSIIDMGRVEDGEYVLDFISTDKAGNVGQGSVKKVILKYDRESPGVNTVRINNTPIQQGEPIFFKEGETVRIQVLMDEKMDRPPRCWVTQQGATGREAGLNQVISEGFDFEYQYVILPSNDGAFDGAVEILVTGGADDAGNPVSPAHREEQAFVVDTLPPVLLRTFISPRDGSTINSAPAPLRLVMSAHPNTKFLDSLPDPFRVRIAAFGPLEDNPSRRITGRFEVFDPRTVDFYPDPNLMNIDGTYLFQVNMIDRVGNEFAESVILTLDTEKLSPNLIVTQVPAPGSFLNYDTFPRLNNKPVVSLAVDESLTAEMSLTNSRVEVLSYLRKPQKFALSQPEVTSTSSLRVSFRDDLKKDGADDGVFSISTRLLDLAGNISDENVYTIIYDTQPPMVLDGDQFPVPEGYEILDYRFPASFSTVRGPLREFSAIIAESRTENGFLGSGLKTSPLSSPGSPTSTMILHLLHPFGSTPANTPVTGRIKFKGELSDDAPLYGGPRVTRLLYELNVDQNSLEPLGIPTGGEWDGIYRAQILPVDMSLNAGKMTTSFFLYDTLPPQGSVAIKNESWITSGVIQLQGSAFDSGARNGVYIGFGSTKGTGVRTVEMRIESVNDRGSATIPALLDWTRLPLDKNPDQYRFNEVFKFDYEQKFHNFEGKARVLLRIHDLAGNITTLTKDVGLDSERLTQPELISPAQGIKLQGGLQRFRWHPVAKADGYVLEIRDKRNNFHRKQLQLGEVDTIFNLDLIEDGELSWRVIPLDGQGKEGPAENGRKIILDRNLPSLLEVQFNKAVVVNDSTGRVLNHKVRMNARFNEELDPERIPTLLFHPAPKEYINSVDQTIFETYEPVPLVQIEIQGRELTADLDLQPADENADYNGIGAVSFENFYDVAGNKGAYVRTDFELDLGPYFDVRIFSNPILDREIIFILKGLHMKGGSVEPIGELPFLQIRQWKDPGRPSRDDRIVPLDLYRLNSSTFQTTFLLDLSLSGRLRLEITGTDEQGNRTTRILPFQIDRISFTSLPTQASLSKISPSTASDLETRLWKFPNFTAAKEEGLELSRAFNYFPARKLPSKVELAYDLDKEGLSGRKIALVRRIGDDYVYEDQLLKESEIQIATNEFHNLFVLEDEKSPLFSVLEGNPESVEDRIVFELRDEGVGVSLKDSQVRLNERIIDFDDYLVDGALEIPEQILPSKSKSQLEVTLKDHLGNTTKKAVALVGAGPVRIQQAIVTPNPVRSSSSSLNLRLNRSIQSLDLLLYDSAGRQIASRTFSQLTASSRVDLDGLVRADLANGVYFLKVKVIDSAGNLDRKTLKIALLR